ncbi:MAG: DNA-packaging protein [Ruminococcus sp.]|nr:DNA-packaging protein [Bacteroidaceae bacterium]MBO5319465.1 DNA-packaging protein [Ruminococcus sp.]
MNKKNKGGRPPMYKTKEEMQEKIDAYFESCKGRILTDNDGNYILDKYGKPIIIDSRPLTVTGLALALGFNTRQALLNYQAKKEFVDTILRAKAVVEQYAEERLFDKDGANGAKFSLANNFEGWKEKQQIEADVNSEVTINIELSDDE